jgi:hypothetical protein
MPKLNTNALSLPYGGGVGGQNQQNKRRQKAKILTHSKDIKIPLWNLISTKHKQQSSFISSKNSQFVVGEPFCTVPFRLEHVRVWLFNS